jgi:xanthine dehydrogenase YagR molybdenum-binding subunit
MLHAALVSSDRPHARVVSIDTSAAEKHPGVRAIHVIEKVLGAAVLRDPAKEMPSKYPIVRYAGQPIAAVAATTPAAAAEAARLVKVDYETLPFVVDVESARAPGAPLVYPGAADQAGTAGGGGGPAGVPQNGNVRGPMIGGAGPQPRGDVVKGFADSEVVVEGEFRTQVQTHSCLEPHGAVVDFRDDGVTVYASTQGTLSVRDEIAALFDLPKTKVRVLTEHMGGGFGSKFGAGNAGVIAAHLSKKAGAPVRLFCTRKEEQAATGNRPDARIRLKVGAKKDGKLQAIHLVNFGTAGVGTGAGVSGPAQNIYDCPNVLTEDHDVFINAGPGAAMRAPGHPQGCFALEQSIDELAEKLGIDVLRLMDLNDSHEARREERRIGAKMIDWPRRRPAGSDGGPIKRGLGVAQSVWYRFTNLDSACEVRIARDGSVEALSAVQDIGGGIRTVIAQIVAEELGLKPSDIAVKIGDTNAPPGPSSGGSTTTCSITPAVREAAWAARTALLGQVASSIGAKASDLDLADGNVIQRGRPGGSLSFRKAAGMIGSEQISAQAQRRPDYGERARMTIGGVQFCEVSVDTETGIVRPTRFVAVHDCGRPMNLLTLESQVNGGILQGISYALYEDRRLDRGTGVMVNPNLEEYRILGAREVPSIEVHFIEQYIARSSTDASGIGEPATIPTAAAIANAVHNAIGVRVRELPMTPARVLASLGKIPAAKRAGGAA